MVPLNTPTRKTISDIVVEVLNETDNPGIMFGDVTLFDMIANRCTHTNLMDKHPMVRHRRILNALENDKRFEKFYVKMNGVIGNPIWRSFKLKKKVEWWHTTPIPELTECPNMINHACPKGCDKC